jgi:hypothetical protein
MNKFAQVLFISLFFFGSIYAQDAFSGKFYMDNQASYDNDKKWFEITRNKYQEIVVISEYFPESVAYYDEQNKEIFFIISRTAQFNTLMKIKVINSNKIKVYALESNRWIEFPENYIKEKNK